MNKKYIVRSFFLVLLMSILIFFDQFTKDLTLWHLKDKAPIDLIDGVLKLQFVSNKGIAWGMFSGKVDVLVITTSIISLLILFILIKSVMRMFFYIKHLQNNPEDTDIKSNIKKLNIIQITLTFLLAGAIGNLIDRITLGYVVDMIYFELIDFPVFNVADMYITVSTIFFIILYAFIIGEDELFEMFKSSNNWTIEDSIKDSIDDIIDTDDQNIETIDDINDISKE